MPSFQRPEQENIVGGVGGEGWCFVKCWRVANMGPSAAATAASFCRAARAYCRHMKRGCFETRLASKWIYPPPPPIHTPMHNACARLHSDAKWSDPLKYLWACFLTERLWLSRAVYHRRCRTAEGVCTHLSCCKAPLSGTWFGSVSWARKHTALSLRLPPLDFGSGWHWAGGGGKKIHHPHTLPPQKWIKIGKQHARAA